MCILQRAGVDDLRLERREQCLRRQADRVDVTHDLVDVRGGLARRYCIARRVVLRGRRNGRRERDRDVAENADRLHRRRGALRYFVLVVHLDQNVEIAGAPQLNVAHIADVHTGQQDGLPLLEILSPGEPRVERISGAESAAHEKERAEDQHDDGDRYEYSDGDFVAAFHPRRNGARTPAVNASSARIVPEVMTTAFAVERPTPSAPASVM